MAFTFTGNLDTDLDKLRDVGDNISGVGIQPDIMSRMQR